MGNAQVEIGMFVAQFALALLFAAVWLMICKALPGLRRKVGFRYGIASALALLACLPPFGGPLPYRFVAGILVVALLYLRWKHALRKYSMEADTIIRYEHPDLF